MVTVIVPIYNTETYLCRCIDSILQSSYTDFELILVNDGSDDCSSFLQNDLRFHNYLKDIPWR